jgi:hypothetical protein
LPGTGISRITLRERAYDLVPVADEKQNGRTEGRPFCNTPPKLVSGYFLTVKTTPACVGTPL